MTKGLAEDLVSQYQSSIPVAILRPSIVTATVSEPLTCWINNLSGATGVFAGSGVGFLRTLLCDPDSKGEIIPADRVINGLIVAPFHINKCWYGLSAQNSTSMNPVYNFVADQRKYITWGMIMEEMQKTAMERNMAGNACMWVYHLSLDANQTVWLLKYYLLHLLPAPFFVLMERTTKMKPRIWLGYVKLFRYTHLYSFFMLKSWKISNSNCQRLFSDLSPEDKTMFNCNTIVDWKHYLYFMTKGIGKYIIKIDWNDHGEFTIKKIILLTLDKLVIWTFRSLVFVSLMKIIF